MTGAIALEVLRLALAAMFAVAGAAKLADLPGAARAARDFGAPGRLALPLAICLACAEVAVAIGLLFAASARAAATAGAALLIVFAAAVAVARLRGRTPDCHCFGRLHSAPAGWQVVARNLIVALAAVAIVVSGSATGIGAEALAAFGLFGLLVGQALLSWTLVRRLGQALRRIDDLERELGAEEHSELDVPEPGIGSEAPAFVLPSTTGTQVALGDLLERDLPLLLVFSDVGCGACTALLPDLARWQRESAEHLTLSVIGSGDVDRLSAAAEEHGMSPILVAPDHSLPRAYGSYGTPSAVLVGADGRIASTVLNGADEIRTLLDPADRAPSPRALVYG